ncbi:hypothetical protein ACTOV4_23170 [Brucella sp. C7-11G]
MGILPLSFTPTGTETSQTRADFTVEPACWIQNPALLPNGKLIAFTHRGQIFLSDDDGGLAIPISPADKYSYSVVWDPVSKRFAFASDVDVADFSSKLQCMTYSSAKELVMSQTFHA